MTEPSRRDAVLAAAGSFTGLWALAWLGSGAVGSAAAIQGGFAVGGVMASSGLATLWWRTRAVGSLHEAAQDEPEEPTHDLGETRAQSRPAPPPQETRGSASKGLVKSRKASE